MQTQSETSARGISRKDLHVYDTFYMLDHFFGRSLTNRLFGKIRQRYRELFLARIRQQQGKSQPIQRRENLSPQQFYEEHFKPGVPVVLAGAAKPWPAVKQWNFDYLAQVAGQDAVTLLPKDRTTDGFKGTREEESLEHTHFENFVADVKKGEGKYLRFSTLVEDHPKLMEDLDLAALEPYFGRFFIGKRIHGFLGNKLSRTRLHCDFPPNLFIQVKGRKHWVLFDPAYRTVIDPLLERSSLSFTTNLEVRSPNEANDSLSKHIDRYETTLEPGDILFNPAYMWHDVYNLDDNIGISIRWLTLGVHWRASWVQQALNLFATNPPIWRAGLSKRDINKDLLDSKNTAKQDANYIG